ncbi:MAG: DUF1573 domain-containing protein [Hyphomicrobiales bacterium]
MKKVIPIIIVALLLVGGIFGGRIIATLKGEIYNKSILTIESKICDFKQISIDTTAYHLFEFTNSGTEDLKLLEVKPYCGCTATEYNEDPIPAGGKSHIKVGFKPYSYGIFNKTVEIRTNSISTPVVYLHVKGKVR